MAITTKKFLDAAGTTHLWEKIVEQLATKASASDVSTLSGQVSTLIGSDTNKSVRTIANEELAAQLIPQNASESLDTLQEIAAWIQSHPGDASAMNAAIQALEAKTTLGKPANYVAATGTYVEGTTYYTDNTGATEVDTSGFDSETDVSSYFVAGPEYATVKAYVEAYVASQVSASSHTHSNKDVLDDITSTKVSNWDSAYTDSHTHSNKALLDTYTQTEANLASAVAHDHQHSNKAELDLIASGDVTKWNAALQDTDVIALTNNEIDAAIAVANSSSQSEEPGE